MLYGLLDDRLTEAAAIAGGRSGVPLQAPFIGLYIATANMTSRPTTVATAALLSLSATA